MAEELEAVKDSFQEVNDCTMHAKMQSSQIKMYSFSFRIQLIANSNINEEVFKRKQNELWLHGCTARGYERWLSRSKRLYCPCPNEFLYAIKPN